MAFIMFFTFLDSCDMYVALKRLLFFYTTFHALKFYNCALHIDMCSIVCASILHCRQIYILKIDFVTPSEHAAAAVIKYIVCKFNSLNI